MKQAMKLCTRTVLLGMLITFSAASVSEAAQWRSSVSTKEDSGQQASQQTLLELYQQIQALQEELTQLRNKVEVQENEMQRLQTRLRSVTEDLDRRVQGLERGGASSGGAEATGGSAANAPVPDGGDQKVYDAAFRLMKQGDYSRAAQSFRKFLATYPNSPLAGNAQYWIGESNYLVRNYTMALEEFQKVTREHPNSRKVPDAMLKTAYSYYELKDYKKARQILTEITFRYPNTQVALSAKSRLALMKKKGQ